MTMNAAQKAAALATLKRAGIRRPRLEPHPWGTYWHDEAVAPGPRMREGHIDPQGTLWEWPHDGGQTQPPVPLGIEEGVPA